MIEKISLKLDLNLTTFFLVLFCFNSFEFYLFVHSRPNDGEAEDSCDRRRKICCDGLDVDVELTPLHCLDDWNPCDADCNLNVNVIQRVI
jgi:hypothetical protein